MDKTLLASPFLLLALMTLVFYVSMRLNARLNASWVNPPLITTLVLIGYLVFTGTPYERFEEASRYLTFWLQPAVVCLAVPLYIEWQKIKSQWLAIVVSQLVGCVVGIVSGVLLVKWLGGSKLALLSVAAKSVTTPIGIEVTQSLGGAPAISAGTIMVAGVLGQMVGLGFLARMHINNPISKSLAMGTASHALGIAAIMPMGRRFVAYGTVGLIVNGILTAFIAPLIVPWLV